MMVKNKLCAILNLTEDDQLLKPLTQNRPIAALPFADRYRVIDFALSSICHAEIDSVALFIAESGRSIYDHIRSGAAWDLDSQVSGGIFTFSQQNWKLRHHQENLYEDYYYNHRVFMSRAKAEYVFVAGSKIIANVDIRGVFRHHVAEGKDITLIYKQLDKEKLGDQNPKSRALKFDTNRQVKGLVEYGDLGEEEKVDASLSMYLLSVKTLNDIIDRAVDEEVYMEVDELVQHYLLDYTVNPYKYTGYMANIDSIQRYYKANMDMLDRQNFTSLFYSSQPILTKTKNGVPSYYAPSSDVRSSVVASGSYLAGKVERSLISRKVHVSEGAHVKESIILQGTKIGDGARVEYAILDKGCVVEPGAHVIGTPDNVVVISKNTVIPAE